MNSEQWKLELESISSARPKSDKMPAALWNQWSELRKRKQLRRSRVATNPPAPFWCWLEKAVAGSITSNCTTEISEVDHEDVEQITFIKNPSLYRSKMADLITNTYSCMLWNRRSWHASLICGTLSKYNGVVLLLVLYFRWLVDAAVASLPPPIA